MASWGNSMAIFNEAVELQNTLANYVRDEKLLNPQLPQDAELFGYLRDMVAEADPEGEFGAHRPNLSTEVIKIWAKLLNGDAV
ncbi:uncharacterized protein BO80DRAFT_444966 [Aspergillus ibericus CBS 121593]|uniref:Uncharacterized protein n=1 Tax=Aspergillus ibericus CBS 121593 TaxID=1448316 RepID=A0A395H1L1_9EURO|nr:hypothetical protein BO80DRAFT_444966 [Aspergillus ibericus CBS 121593]RAL01105.1 hypothetical protein BO80DRAFT_444966 [Aspergillus ibericus CBS 121593]